jgi:uncharacterized membrane protein
MRSRSSIVDHPIHPMLVPIPIGLAIWTLVADLLYLFTGENTMWYDIAFWSGLAAWVTALAAAIPGLVDYLSMAVKTDARDMATAHLVLNVTAVVLYVVSTAVMWDHGALHGGSLVLSIVLHGIGVGLLGLSGWLGGEMVYRHHLSVIPDTMDLERAEQQRHYEALARPAERRP